MASLMQSFAKIKQQRLNEIDELAANYRQEQAERALQLQAQAAETAENLAQSHQGRLVIEQNRQAIATNSQAQRSQEVQARAISVKSQLHKTRIYRLAVAISDSMERSQAVKRRSDAVSAQLGYISKARLVAAIAATKQRQQQSQDRTTHVRSSLAQIHSGRLIAAIVDNNQRQTQDQNRVATAKAEQEQRLQNVQARTKDVQEQLQNLKVERILMAEDLNQQLNEYREHISQAVWGDHEVEEIIAKPLTVSKPASKITPTVTESSTAPTIIKPVPVVVPETKPVVLVQPELPKKSEFLLEPTNHIEEFIQNYVSQLEGNPTLLQIINDRDTVRDLLAQGANSLKVDPSDILNALLHMANPG